MLPSLTVVLAHPRGFCAGVNRAILIVEKALARYGAPVYVRHEIVHNAHVVNRLKSLGAVFVDELDEVPDDRPVIFSAHGVPKSIPESAKKRQMTYLDATCPLVSKVHREVEQYQERGYTVVLIGHAGHPEVIGTLGQANPGVVHLIETAQDVATLENFRDIPLAYVTQTTLSVDETAQVIEALRARFPHIEAPRKDDICYATTNRQEAVKAIAPHVECLLVIGSSNSSNSKRLVEVGEAYGCPKSHLILEPHDLDPAWLEGVTRLGITAGASAPEELVDQLIDLLRQSFFITLETVSVAEENIVFHLPKAFREDVL